MLVNCGVIFLSFLLLMATFFITASKRQNICFLVSLLCGIVVSVILYILEYFYSLGFEGILLWIRTTFKYLPTFPEKVVEQLAFGYGLILIAIFLIVFLIIYVLMNILVPKENYLLKKNRYYYVTKGIYVFVNIISIAFVLIVIITDLNMVYLIPRGFLEAVMELFEQGLLFL